MSSKPQTVSLTIMGKEYKIACEPDEQENLIQSASELDAQMCKMRDSGKVGSPERIAVMAALNLSHELQSLKKQSPAMISQSWKDCLARMMSKVENVLEKR
jgi:cell division protein ZapA